MKSTIYYYIKRRRKKLIQVIFGILLLSFAFHLLMKKDALSLSKTSKDTNLQQKKTCTALFVVIHFRIPLKYLPSISSGAIQQIKEKLESYTNTSEGQVFVDDEISDNGLPESMHDSAYYIRSPDGSRGKCGFVWGFDKQNHEVKYDTCKQKNLKNSWKFCKLPLEMITEITTESAVPYNKYCTPNFAASWPLQDVNKCALSDEVKDLATWVKYAKILDKNLMNNEFSNFIGYPIKSWQVLGLVIEYDMELLDTGFEVLGTAPTSKFENVEVEPEFLKHEEKKDSEKPDHLVQIVGSTEQSYTEYHFIECSTTAIQSTQASSASSPKTSRPVESITTTIPLTTLPWFTLDATPSEVTTKTSLLTEKVSTVPEITAETKQTTQPTSGKLFTSTNVISPTVEDDLWNYTDRNTDIDSSTASTVAEITAEIKQTTQPTSGKVFTSTNVISTTVEDDLWNYTGGNTDIDSSTASTVAEITAETKQTTQITSTNVISTTVGDDLWDYTDGKTDEERYYEMLRKIYPDMFPTTSVETENFSSLPSPSTRVSVTTIPNRELDVEGSGGFSSVAVTASYSTDSNENEFKDTSTTANTDNSTIFLSSQKNIPATTIPPEIMNDLLALKELVHKIYGIVLDDLPVPFHKLMSKIHNATHHTHADFKNENSNRHENLNHNGIEETIENTSSNILPTTRIIKTPTAVPKFDTNDVTTNLMTNLLRHVTTTLKSTSSTATSNTVNNIDAGTSTQSPSTMETSETTSAFKRMDTENKQVITTPMVAKLQSTHVTQNQFQTSAEPESTSFGDLEIDLSVSSLQPNRLNTMVTTNHPITVVDPTTTDSSWMDSVYYPSQKNSISHAIFKDNSPTATPTIQAVPMEPVSTSTNANDRTKTPKKLNTVASQFPTTTNANNVDFFTTIEQAPLTTYLPVFSPSSSISPTSAQQPDEATFKKESFASTTTLPMTMSHTTGHTSSITRQHIVKTSTGSPLVNVSPTAALREIQPPTMVLNSEGTELLQPRTMAQKPLISSTIDLWDSTWATTVSPNNEDITHQSTAFLGKRKQPIVSTAGGNTQTNGGSVFGTTKPSVSTMHVVKHVTTAVPLSIAIAAEDTNSGDIPGSGLINSTKAAKTGTPPDVDISNTMGTTQTTTVKNTHIINATTPLYLIDVEEGLTNTSPESVAKPEMNNLNTNNTDQISGSGSEHILTKFATTQAHNATSVVEISIITTPSYTANNEDSFGPNQGTEVSNNTEHVSGSGSEQTKGAFTELPTTQTGNASSVIEISKLTTPPSHSITESNGDGSGLNQGTVPGTTQRSKENRSSLLNEFTELNTSTLVVNTITNNITAQPFSSEVVGNTASIVDISENTTSSYHTTENNIDGSGINQGNITSVTESTKENVTSSPLPNQFTKSEKSPLAVTTVVNNITNKFFSSKEQIITPTNKYIIESPMDEDTTPLLNASISSTMKNWMDFDATTKQLITTKTSISGTEEKRGRTTATIEILISDETTDSKADKVIGITTEGESSTDGHLISTVRNKLTTYGDIVTNTKAPETVIATMVPSSTLAQQSTVPLSTVTTNMASPVYILRENLDPDTFVSSTIVGKWFEYELPSSWIEVLKTNYDLEIMINMTMVEKVHSSDLGLITESWLVSSCPELGMVCGVPVPKNRTEIYQISTFILSLSRNVDTVAPIMLHVSIYPTTSLDQINYEVNTYMDVKNEDNMAINNDGPRLFIQKLVSYLQTQKKSLILPMLNLLAFKIVRQPRRKRSISHSINAVWNIHNTTLDEFNSTFKSSLLDSRENEVAHDFFISMLPEFIVNDLNIISTVPASNNFGSAQLMVKSGQENSLTSVLIPIFITVIVLLSCVGFLVVRRRKHPMYFITDRFVDKTFGPNRKPIFLDEEMEMDYFRPSKARIMMEDYMQEGNNSCHSSFTISNPSQVQHIPGNSTQNTNNSNNNFDDVSELDTSTETFSMNSFQSDVGSVDGFYSFTNASFHIHEG